MNANEFKTRLEYERAYRREKLYAKGVEAAELVYVEFYFYCRWKGYDISKNCKTAWNKYLSEDYPCGVRARNMYSGTDDRAEIYRDALNEKVMTEQGRQYCRRYS